MYVMLIEKGEAKQDIHVAPWFQFQIEFPSNTHV